MAYKHANIMSDNQHKKATKLNCSKNVESKNR